MSVDLLDRPLADFEVEMGPPSDGAVVFLDLTRLVSRALISTPSGIDRVEMAYARYCAAHRGDEIQYVLFIGRAPRIIPQALAKRFIQATERRWSGETWGELPVKARRLQEFGKEFGFYQNKTVAGVREKRSASEILRLTARILATALVPADRFMSRRGGVPVYVNVSHKGLHLSFVRQWLSRRQAWKAIYLVHDTIPVAYPEYVKPGDDEKHWRRLKNIAATASAIIVNTNFTGESLRHVLKEDIAPELPIEVAPLGVEPMFRPRNVAAPHGSNYFVCVGTIEPRKNHLMLLQVWRRLVTDLGQSAPKLVLVGRRGWENENIIDVLERSHELKEFVYEYPRLPDIALTNLMAGARAILFPSFVEGYGLPVVEALAQRVPVLCSDIAAHREIGGHVPDLLDPLDGPSWLAAVVDYNRVDSGRRVAQMQRMAQYEAPTWNQHFSVLNRVLARIAA